MEREIAVVIWLALTVAIVVAIDNAARREREQCEKHANWQLVNDILEHDMAKRQREGERMSATDELRRPLDELVGGDDDGD